MKIALISFEYLPDTGYGGIATTTRQLARLLHQVGHHVEVFAGSNSRSKSQVDEDGFWVHRVLVKQRIDFVKAVVPVFLQHHKKNPFDLIESPEFGADAAGIVQAVPHIPLAVRLHTPTVMVAEHDGKDSWQNVLRIKLGAFRRGINPLGDLEHRLALDADELIAPSWAIGKELMSRWQLEPELVHHIPNPFTPSKALLQVPIKVTTTNVVTFIGRLNLKKGVTDLAAAIPEILERYPDAKFRFVGRNGDSPNPGQTMQAYLEHKLKPHLSAIEFTGPVKQEHLATVLAETDVCVFPSRWENFPNVCLEAMAAGKAVVGSQSGGMAEMLPSDQIGRLVPPHAPDAIAAAVIDLLKQPALRVQLGQNARQRVLTEYNLERIAHLQEQSYQRAIARRQQLGPRRQRLLL